MEDPDPEDQPLPRAKQAGADFDPQTRSSLLAARKRGNVRLPGQGDSNMHGARPVHRIISIMKWIRTSRLSINNSLSPGDHGLAGIGHWV